MFGKVLSLQSARDTDIFSSTTHEFRLAVLAVAIDLTMIAINSSLSSSNGDSRDSGNSSAHMINSNQHCDAQLFAHSAFPIQHLTSASQLGRMISPPAHKRG